MVKRVFDEMNKILTFSILVFVVVSLASESVSGSSNLQNNYAPSSYSGKYFVPSPNSSSDYVRIIDLIKVSVNVDVSILRIMKIYMPSLGPFVPSFYLGENSVPISDRCNQYLQGSGQSSYLDKDSVPISNILKGFVPSSNSGKDSLMIYDQMKNFVPSSESGTDHISPSSYSKGFSKLSNLDKRSVKPSNSGKGVIKPSGSHKKVDEGWSRKTQALRYLENSPFR